MNNQVDELGYNFKTSNKSPPIPATRNEAIAAADVAAGGHLRPPHAAQRFGFLIEACFAHD